MVWRTIGRACTTCCWTRNLAAALFRLENSQTPEDMRPVVRSLIQWIYAPQQASLRRAFTVWLKRVLLPGRLPGIDIPEIADLNEVDNMLAERVQEWTQQWKADGLKEGLEKGLEKGLKKGRKEGEITLLLRLLENRFGPLDEHIRPRLEAADTEQLLRWGERVLSADSLDEVFS